jgi:hypothetical protein
MRPLQGSSASTQGSNSFDLSLPWSFSNITATLSVMFSDTSLINREVIIATDVNAIAAQYIRLDGISV